MGRRVTIRDIASACGVSPTLVSKALNDHAGVGVGTKSLIVETARNLGYDFGRLKSAVIDRVAVLMLEDHDLPFGLPFFSTVLSGIDEVGKLNKIGMSFSSIGQQDDITKAIAQANCRAAIFLGYIPENMRKAIADVKYPVVTVDSVVEQAVSFNTNNFELSYQLTSHVIEQGIVDIAFLMPLRDHNTILERERGFLQALYDHNVTMRPEYRQEGEPLGRKKEEMDKAIRYLLGLKCRPQAIVAFNDLVALEVIRVAAEFGLKVPEDLLVTGFDNIDFSGFTSPSITTAAAPGRAMGQAAMKALLEHTVPSSYIIKGEIIIRESSLRPSDLMPK